MSMTSHVTIENSPTITYRRLLSNIRPHWLMFFIGIMGTVLYSGLDASLTYGLKIAVDEGFIARNTSFIHWLPLALLFIFVLRGTASFVSTYFVTWVGRTIVKEFRQKVFSHFLKLPAAFYDTHSCGSLLSILLYNVEQIAQASTDALIVLVRESVFVSGLVVVMLVVSWQLTLSFLLVAPVITFVVRAANRKTRRLSKTVQALIGDITQVAEEAITGFRVIRIFGGENYESDKFNKAAEHNRRRELRVALLNGLTSPLVQLMVGIVIMLIVYLAATKITPVSPGGFAAVIAAMLAILKPIKNLTTVNATIQKGIAAADGIFQLLDEAVEEDTGTVSMTRARGELLLRDVSFHYPKHDQFVLQRISFSVKPGQTVALVGRSGSGKSTLVNLLPRFYDYQSGRITLDGVDIQGIALSDLRSQFSLVSQHVVLFNDTIARNIAYGQFDTVDIKTIEEAARAAHALEFIQQLPQGFDTVIGDKGLRLSGGQRQRIAIARAILKNAPILILDEATSALDTEAERHIQIALDQLMRKHTTIVIAHRLSTIENADHIIVLDGGCIVEQGTHQQLLASDKLYARLYYMQFKEQHETAVS